MKKLLIILMLTAGGFSETFSQSVGIGTTTPNANAILDITSTTKGFLLPRMTQAQRILISSPVNGLLVYDVTTERLYQYQDAVWRALINNSYWAKPTDGRDRMYNNSDSIGIGTSAPTEKLHVVGNIRSSEKISAGAVIEGVGLFLP